jgi:uncharacterized protein YggL (DUF469 family)
MVKTIRRMFLKKRLRKKNHLKEFTEFGIDIDFSMNVEISEEDFDSLINRFISDFVEGNGLFCGGGWNPKERTAGFIIEVGRNKEKCTYYAKELKNWFDNEGIKPPETYKIVDLWNDKELAFDY